MSSRPIFKPASVITNGNMASASLTSAITILTNLSMISYGLSWSGTAPVGTAEVQVSNDYSQNGDGSTKNAGTWTTLTLSVAGSPSTTVAITGNTGTAFIDIDQIAAYAIRLVFTKTSGTGTLQAVVNGKVA